MALDLNIFFKKKMDYNLKIFNKSKKRKKYDPVTNFDKNFEKFIRESIKKKFKRDAIDGEEFKYLRGSSNYLWIIDPIDGTKKFIKNIPTWSNLIGLSLNNKFVLGLANFPDLNRFYICDNKNSFIYKNAKKKKLLKLKKKNKKKLKISINFHEKYSKKKKKFIISKFKNATILESYDALSYCLLVEGKIDVVIEANLKSYDIAPLIPIIKNAGGSISNWKNKSAINGGNILATSNKTLHNKFYKILKFL